MKLAAFSASLPDLSLTELLDYLHANGINALELGVGGYPGTRHASALTLIESGQARQQLLNELASRGISLAALSCHGNPLHPDSRIATAHHHDLLAALEVANAMEVPVVVGFSGQPGTGEVLNWPVVAWPDEYRNWHERVWSERLIPYWQGIARRAETLGVRIALEMHGGFAVHSPATALKLRTACGDAIGVNLDPSHFWWQSIDPLLAIELLGDSIHHVHLKDVSFNPARLVTAGVLDCTPFTQPSERAWYFSAPGEGHDATFWSSFIDSLQSIGYTGVASIEHEGTAPAIEAVARTAKWMRSIAPTLKP